MNGTVCCISTGEKIDENIIKGILGSKVVGEAQLLKFMKECLVNGTASFFHSITKQIQMEMRKEKKAIKKGFMLREDQQAFGLNVSEADTLEKGFKFPLR